MNTTIRIVGGGEPSDEELAALTMALDALLAENAERAEAMKAVSGWLRAALHEGVGGRTVSAPGETAG